MSEETKQDDPKVNHVEPTSDEEPQAPKVFIAYSHDSTEHKQWVAALALKLMAKRVDVDFDQWGLGLGDDVPKYMEKAVTEADRVLMICTEAYVRKADEGKGGVGYEAMVVTGELVRKLQTNKFIPVIRQTGGEPVLPKSVSTRLYVNLSEGQAFDEEFEKLVREIHQVPKLPKPPLGNSPFPQQKNISETPITITAVKLEDADAAYATATQIIKAGDFKAWRELTRKVREPLSGRLTEWRKQYDGKPSLLVKDLPDIVLQATSIYSPLMAVALAGVESGNSKFTNQQAMLDEFLRPKDWNGGGLTVLTRLPEAVVFTYQALHGATCLEVGELGLAIALSKARVTPAHRSEAVILHQEHGFIGWPESLQRNCITGWKYLTDLTVKWPWLLNIFDSERDYRASLCAYYMALNIQELAAMLAAGKQTSLDKEQLSPDVPTSWIEMAPEIQQRGYRKLLNSEGAVRVIWRNMALKDSTMAGAWTKWLEHVQRWAFGLYPSRFHLGLGHATLFEDIKPEN